MRSGFRLPACGLRAASALLIAIVCSWFVPSAAIAQPGNPLVPAQGSDRQALPAPISLPVPVQPQTTDTPALEAEKPAAAHTAESTKHNTFFAIIHLTVKGEAVVVDARPSDAIALALRTRAPILVDETVIDNAKTVDFASERADSDRLQKWLESLDPDDMGKYKM